MHPLLDAEGSCSLIYDLERAAVLEVPEELRLHVAPALDAGDLDDELLSWLVTEDLLTTESWAVWDGQTRLAIRRPDWGMRARVSAPDPELVGEILDCIFKQSRTARTVHLLLDWSGSFPGVPLVEQVMLEARQMAAAQHQQTSFELALDSGQVNLAVASYLATTPSLRLRLRCGAFPARDAEPEARRAWEARTAPLTFLAGLLERTTVQCCLGSGARLRDLWAWGRQQGILHLDTERANLAAAGDSLPPGAQVREYRDDLLAVCDELASELEERRIPIDYRPLTRVIHRLMTAELDIEPEPELEPEPEPVWDTRGALWPDLWSGGESSGAAAPRPGAQPRCATTNVSTSSPCQTCWGRSLCRHSSLLGSSVEDDQREPSPHRCPIWLTEAEVGLGLYYRLAHCNPLDVVRFVGDSEHIPRHPSGRWEDLAMPKQPF